MKLSSNLRYIPEGLDVDCMAKCVEVMEFYCPGDYEGLQDGDCENITCYECWRAAISRVLVDESLKSMNDEEEK